MNKDALLGALKSKTIWINGVVGIAGLLDYVLSNSGVITAVLPGIAPYLGVLGAVNVILRFVTTQPLADKA